MTNKLFEIFAGELVRITTKLYVVEGNDKESFQVPITRDGYLLEQDDINYYFGKDPLSVTFSIKRIDISMIELIETEVMVINPLMNMDGPKGVN